MSLRQFRGIAFLRIVIRKILRELNALRTLPVYPVFANEKSNGKTKKAIRQEVGSTKIYIKNTSRINITATNSFERN